MADLVNHKTFANDRYEILTPTGFQDFVGVIEGTNKCKLKVTTNKSQIVCTPEHKFINEGGDIVYAKDLKIGQQLANNNSIVNIVDEYTDDLVYELLEVGGNHQYFANEILMRQCLICDELGFIEPESILEEFWRSVWPTVSRAKTSKVLIASTPNGTGNLFHKLVEGADKGENGFVIKRLRWNVIPGRDEAWKQEQIKALGSIDAFLQENENVFLNAGDTAIDEALFYHYSQQCQEPVEIRGNMRIYKHPRNGAQYIAGVDIAEGVGEDASVIQIIDISDITNIEQVAVYHNNKISPLEFANVCLETFAEWGNPIALIERNNQGGQVVDRLYYDNNYTQIVSYGAKITGRTKTQIGVISHTNTKSRAVANMRHFVNILKCIKFNDIETVKEFKKFTRQANSTWKAESGYHDDRVMSFIWALMILEKEITEQWFNVLKCDDYGKPLMLENLDFGVSKYINEKSMFNEDDYSTNVSIRPVVFGMGDSEMPSEFFELQQQGWELL